MLKSFLGSFEPLFFQKRACYVQTALLLILWLVAMGCGVKSAPQPPIPPAPPSVTLLKAFSRENYILLRWSMPKPDEKLRQTQAIEFFIYRSYLAEGTDEWTEFTKVGETPLRGESDEIFWKDTNLKSGFSYRYIVRSVDAKNKLSPPSPIVETAWTVPPPAPLELQTQIGDRWVTLVWKTPPSDVNIAGYNIYRSDGGEFVRINEFIVPTPTYFDGALENGKKYSYQVRAVTMMGTVQVEGAPSGMVEASPIDNVSPQTPVGVDAFPVEEGVLVRWWRNSEHDLAGYFIYRTLNGKTEKITPEPVLDVEYMDRNAIFGKTYFYQVSAVDRVGNESPKSEPAKVYVKR